ncbi:hypothetical protein LIER_34288 [Lithospermum erythrorhizon]|uniref:Scarecrow-like protein 28 n=1 Tax=Lithospermum erythrorhizon TaxID=34254 RepID=A0AAV3S1G4_LITER
MLAGCSSTLVSPRHRLRSEASAQFQACNFPSMSTQRLDLPCSFPRKDGSRSQSIRPVGLSIEKPIEARSSSGSLKQSIRLPPSPVTLQSQRDTYGEDRRDEKGGFLEKNKSLKRRYVEQEAFDDDVCFSRVKRKRGTGKSGHVSEEDDNLGLRQLGNGNLWLQPGFEERRLLIGTGIDQQQIPFSLTCSGVEERVRFVPSNVIDPPLPPLSHNPWLESIAAEVTDLGDKNAESSQGRMREVSGSSTASESHGLVLGLNENPLQVIQTGNGSGNPGEDMGVVAHHNERNRHEENEGLELVNLLVNCVGSIGAKNIPGISHFISILGELSSPKGSNIHRISAYFTEALALRAARLWPHIFHITPPRELDRLDDDGGTALRLLNQVSPIPKFIQFTANEILLRAFDGKDRVHIIDFDIKQGLQWPSLFQSLATRTSPPSHVRITGVGDSKKELIETGDRLAGFAESLDLPFEFHPVVDRLEDVRLWMLHVKERESVAINCTFQMHKVLYDSTGGALKDFLGVIRSTNPSIVVMAEQEAELNEPILEARFCNALKYYSAIFDSIDSSGLPLDSQVRMKIEEMLAREIRNIISCEGRDRFERHETFAKWMKSMEQGGFRSSGISEREFLQSQLLLKMHTGEDYRVERQQAQDDGAAAALTLSWSDQPLYTVSAWVPVDVAGSSSSTQPQPK